MPSSQATACVGNTGTRAGVACFKIGSNGLLPLDEVRRPFALNQSNPPTGNPNTVSQVLFNHDSTALIALVKGDPSTPGNHGFIAVFPIREKRVSRDAVMSSPSNTTSLFGAALIPETTNILITDPTIGAALVSIDINGYGHTLSVISIAGQIATCWAIFSPQTGTVFVTDGAVNSLVEIDPITSTVTRDQLLPNNNTTLIDAVAAGDFVYSLFPGDGINPAAVVVVDVSGGPGVMTEVQNFLLRGIIQEKSSQGLAAYY